MGDVKRLVYQKIAQQFSDTPRAIPTVSGSGWRDECPPHPLTEVTVPVRVDVLGFWATLADRFGQTIDRFFRWLDSIEPQPTEPESLERPWLINWQWVPKRSAGPGFGPAEYARARQRGVEVARQTLGDEQWSHLIRRGFVDVRSQIMPGLTYRLRIGRRVELVWDSPAEEAQSPWPYRYLCINPTYPLPAVEFLSQLYLYVRDREPHVLQVAAPQPFDQLLGRVF